MEYTGLHHLLYIRLSRPSEGESMGASSIVSWDLLYGSGLRRLINDGIDSGVGGGVRMTRISVTARTVSVNEERRHPENKSLVWRLVARNPTVHTLGGHWWE